MAVTVWLLPFGCYRFAVTVWLLPFGCYRLAVSVWLLLFWMLPFGCYRLTVTIWLLLPFGYCYRLTAVTVWLLPFDCYRLAVTVLLLPFDCYRLVMSHGNATHAVYIKMHKVNLRRPLACGDTGHVPRVSRGKSGTAHLHFSRSIAISGLSPISFISPSKRALQVILGLLLPLLPATRHARTTSIYPVS